MMLSLRTLLFGGPDVAAAFRGLGRPLPGMFQPGVTLMGNDEASDIIPSSPPLYDADTLADRTERSVYFCETLFEIERIDNEDFLPAAPNETHTGALVGPVFLCEQTI